MTKNDFMQELNDISTRRHLRYQIDIDEILDEEAYQAHIDNFIGPISKEQKKEKKAFERRRKSSQRLSVEALIRNAQEDLLNNTSPPKEYTRLITHLLCNYLDEINAAGVDSKPAWLSKHLHLSGKRKKPIAFYYSFAIRAFNNGFEEYKYQKLEGDFDVSEQAIESRAMRTRMNKIQSEEAYFNEGKILALSGSAYIQQQDLVNVMMKYEHRSESGADKDYYRLNLERYIKKNLAPN